jgi:hypothetical protein
MARPRLDVGFRPGEDVAQGGFMEKSTGKAKKGEREARLQQAVDVALARELRKEHPQGDWQDGLWYPAPEERRPCCEKLAPSPGNKQALDSHCRSKAHIANLFDVPVAELKRAVLLARRRRAVVSDLAGRPLQERAAGIEALAASAQVAMRNAKRELLREVGRLAPLLDEDGPEMKTLEELVAVTENLEHHLEFFRKVAQTCREAQEAEQAYRQIRQSA